MSARIVSRQTQVAFNMIYVLVDTAHGKLQCA